MTQNLETLDMWRKFFQTANSDIYVIIENAICVAAKDCPQEFRSKRDKIAQDLFSCTLTKCIGCDHVESSGGSEERLKSGLERKNDVFGKGVSVDISKVISSEVDQKMVNVKQVCDSSAEALSNELEKECQVIDEVMKIKKIFENKYEEPESVLLDLLRRLQLLDLSVDNLHATKIGKNVSLLRKHRSKEISLLSKTLIKSWKNMVNDQWSLIKQTIAEAADTPESVKPLGLEGKGLPSPPLEEGIFFLNNPTYFEFSKFFDGIDNYGNTRESEDLSKNLDAVPSKKNKSYPKMSKPNPNPPKTEYGSGRQVKVNVDKKNCSGSKFEQKTDKGSIQNRQTAYNKEKFKSVDLDRKFEATKRKLHEDYQEVQNTKKQRTIKMVEVCDVPKQRLSQRNLRIKLASPNRLFRRR